MYHHVKRATRHLIFWSLVLAAILLTLIRLWLSGVEHYKTSLETRISAQIGAPVKLGDLGAKMRGITPELVLKNITVGSAIKTEKPALSLSEIRLGLNLGELLLSRDILSAARISLIGANISIYRDSAGKFIVEGLRTGEGQPLWLLQGREYQLLHSEVIWQDRQLGGAPVRLDDVNLAIVNDGNKHRINVLAQLPERYGEELKFILDVQSSPENLPEMKGNFYLEGKTLKLQELIDNYLPYNNHVIGGTADFKLWGSIEQASLTGLSGNVSIGNTIFSHPGKENLTVNKLDSRWHWRQNENGWQLDCHRFLLETVERGNKPANKWPDAIFSVAGISQDQEVIPVFKAYVKELEVAEIRKLTEFFAPLPENLSRVLRESQLEGYLQEFYQYVEPQSGAFAVAGHVDALSIAPFQSYPGIKNIKARFKGNEKTGQVEIMARNVLFKKETVFDKTIEFDKVSGLFIWRQNDTEWEIDSPAMLLDSQSVASESRLHLTLPKTEDSPYMDLQTAFSIGDVRQITHYLPTPIMTSKLHNWLSHAFEKGVVRRGDLLWVGKFDDFPYEAGNGVFQVLLALENINLHYHPEWLNISGINGNLLIEKNNIVGKFNKGVIGKADITKSDMLISGLNSDPVIAITGDAKGNIIDVLSVLQQSPLADRINSLLAHTAIMGSTQGTLSLNIPLKSQRELTLSGSAQLANAKLTLNSPNLPISDITGEIKFNNNGIYSDTIKATALGKPITADINQLENVTRILAKGRASAAGVLKLFDGYDAQAPEGESDFQLQLELPNKSASSQPVKLTIESGLEGIAIQIPGIVSKTQAQKKPTKLSITLGSDSLLPVTLNYNDELKAVVNLDTDHRKVVSGNIVLGTGEIGVNHANGVKLKINKEQLALQDWLALAADRKQALDSWLPITEINFYSNTAFWQKTKIGVFDLTIKNSQNTWSGDINSIFAKGNFAIPFQLNAMTPLTLNLDMLNLSALKQLHLEGSAPETDVKPLLKVQSTKTLWRSVNLGKLELDTVRIPQGLAIKQCSLKGQDEKLTMTGDWVSNQLGSSTRLKGELDLKKADQFFNKLNITKDFTETKGKVDFNLNWSRAPWRLTLPDLRGSMDIKLKNGRILSIEPGFGRVLGILAMAQWIKRLQLDFSDVFEEGLTFNSIKGHFDLVNGKALTQDLTIDAVPAMITIAGDTDLVKQTVDHTIKVVPKSYDAVPIAGTIVGKVAELIGKSITGKDQAGFFFGREYLVKGQWDKVSIKPLHENDGLLQKTWNSMTDFPWLEPSE